MAVTHQGRDGELRIYDGSNPRNFVKVRFAGMDFQGPLGRPRPPDPISPTVGGYTHTPSDPSYEAAFYEPVPVSFSCWLDDNTNSWKLRDALCNPSLHDTWQVGGATWLSTKGRGSVIAPDGEFLPTQPFFDIKKVAVDIEVLWDSPHTSAGTPMGLAYRETYFPPQDSVFQESADFVTIQASGLSYGNVEVIGQFSPGNES